MCGLPGRRRRGRRRRRRSTTTRSTNDDEVLSKEVVEAELERLLCDQADDPENATCAIHELQSALKETYPGMTVEDDALQAILTVLEDVDFKIDIVRNVIAMAV